MKRDLGIKYEASSYIHSLTNKFSEYFISKVDLISEGLGRMEMNTTHLEYKDINAQI